MILLFFICALIIIALSVIAGFVVFSSILDAPNRSLLAICLAIFLSQIMAAGFFLTSLRAFKAELRAAYRVVAIGILLYTLTLVPLPSSSFVELDPFILSSFTIFASLSGTIVMYIGVRKFSKLLQLKSAWRNMFVVLGMVALFALVTVLLPHGAMASEDRIMNDIFFSFFVASAGFSVPTALLALRIRTMLSPRYKSGLIWLSAALIAVALASIHETTIKIVPYFSQPQFDNFYAYGFSLWPFLVSSLLFLKASMSFRQASKELSVLPDDATYLDAINHLANIVSNPAAIDVTLDKVRSITASHQGGDTLSSQDRTVLRKVYLDIETYLVTKEPLRKLSRDELRDLLPEALKQDVAKK
jgi:hypothetical protein